MDCDENHNLGAPPAPEIEESRTSAVNSLILDYYKKFGRKRDLEQYFSLSTAHNDVRDPSSIFWARMKAENESSDSGERSDKKSESSQELCRISIRFPAQDPCTSQEEDSKTKTESVSPPIIIEEVTDSRQNSDDEATKSDDEATKSDDEAIKSDDNNSQKSYDVLLDTSMNKPHSPSSSITSQRKLEWDSLADVGYANESDRKTSASSLSTLERLALKQQYSNNDTQHDSNLGLPTAHSTPLDENDTKIKSKKSVGKKTTKIYKKDVDFLEVNVPHSSNINPPQSINVNLTKHISFNVEKDGKVTVENVQKDVNVLPEKVSVETEVSPRQQIDKEIQTSLTKAKESTVAAIPEDNQAQPQKIPIMISLNTLRYRVRSKKLRMARRKLRSKKRSDKDNIPVQEKSGEQLSEAESFEYMPGHIYNQNQITANSVNSRPSQPTDNKSSLESSAGLTDSSKGSKHSFSKDLEKSIDLLKTVLQQRCDDSTLRKQLIKQVCRRLLKSKYRDDDSNSDFLSGLTFNSEKLDLGEKKYSSTSTSDMNKSPETSKRPKKSILRVDKFNPGSIASTSQSAPNLPVASNSDKLVTCNLAKNMTSSNTDTDMSIKEKVSSEELYQKYLHAVRREEAYKKHLKDKEIFLKQKLVSSDNAFKVPTRVEVKPSNKLKDLINDLTRNNYDDGSGDASKLEGGPGSNRDFDRFIPNGAQRSHSVFTLSSGNSDGNNKKPNLKKRLQCNIQDLSKPGPSKYSHYCCCPHHSGNLKYGVTDSSVQVDIKNLCRDDSCPAGQRNQSNFTPKEGQKADSPRKSTRVTTDDETGDLKYVCLCSNKGVCEVPENILIYKCSRLINKGVQLEETSSKASNKVYIHCSDQTCNKRTIENVPSTSAGLSNKSSQTNMLGKMLQQESANQLFTRSDGKIFGQKRNDVPVSDAIFPKSVITICEGTRCIQTEISINPKLPDPALSDIKIVSDTDCAKLICEHHRELSKPSLRSRISSQGEGSAKSANSCKSAGIYKDVTKDLEDVNHFDTSKKSNKEKIRNQEINIEQLDNFTIPIQGTNMTLMVRIGSDRKGTTNKEVGDVIDQGTGTDRINVIEQATSLTEECSKGVQFDKSANDCNKIDHNSNKIDDDYKIIKSFEHPSKENTCLTTDEPRFSTYPKTSPVIDREPFRRSYSDSDKVIDDQEMFSTVNVGAIENIPVDTQTENKVKNNNNVQDEKCSCGCSGSKENCKIKCKNRKCSPRYKRRAVFDQQSCSQKDLPNKQSENCETDCIETESSLKQTEEFPCRYDALTDNSKNNCKESTYSPRGNCQKQFVDQKVPTHKDFMEQKIQDFKENKSTPKDTEKRTLDKDLCGRNDNHRAKCLCGCGATKNNCKNNCRELKTTLRKNRNTSPMKEVCVKKDLPPGKSIQSDNCLCGCGGTKDNCKNNCKEHKSTPRGNKNTSPSRQTCSKKDIPDDQTNCIQLNLTPREHYRPQTVDKQIYTAHNAPELQHEKCLCGCAGTKDNCKENCSERNVTPQNPYKTPSEQKEVGTQKYLSNKESPENSGRRQINQEPKYILRSTEDRSTSDDEHFKKPAKRVESRGEQANVKSSDNRQKITGDTEQIDKGSDPILNMIQNITKKYSKNEVEKGKRKKCFREIMTILNYLLETDDTDVTEDQRKIRGSTTTANDTEDSIKKTPEKSSSDKVAKKLDDKRSHPSAKKSNTGHSVTESSDLPISTDIPGTSSESATCKVLNRIKKECERYQKRCKVHSGKKCDATSTTSVTCEQCRRVHHCSCRNHKCKGHKKCSEKIQKNPVAYNLILQTSESIVSEGAVCDAKNRQLKNIIVKVPKKTQAEFVPFREMVTKFEKKMPCAVPCAPPETRSSRSRSWPNETDISSMEEIIRKSQGATVREYLERNRPDFIERCSRRQSCLKYISDTRDGSMLYKSYYRDPFGVVWQSLKASPILGLAYLPLSTASSLYTRANERAVKRDLLSLHVAQLSDVTDLDIDDMYRLAKGLGRHMRQKRPAPKFISEREMKRHSEKIYKSLPEVVQKKEDKKKENNKRTNLLMANIFKKNLQKKTLRGSVNLSNYSQVIKI